MCAMSEHLDCESRKLFDLFEVPSIYDPSMI